MGREFTEDSAHDDSLLAARCVRAGGVALFCAVGLGAFGAHGLHAHLEELGRQATFGTAVDYHFWHALALLALAGVPLPARTKRRAGRLIVAGLVLFSGSLYALALTDLGFLGAITPIGGLAFLGASGTVAWGAHRRLHQPSKR